MKIFILIIVAAVLAIPGCTQRENKPAQKMTVNRAWLDSILTTSDSSYAKAYKRGHFDSAFYYINKKDSSVCQLMKDPSRNIRQVIIARKNVRSFFAAYYANGQLQANLPLDAFGQYHGRATYYFANGGTESTGNYEHGIKTGTWKYFDEKGKLVSTDTYDDNGQVVK
ncbi:MAG TPA: hypothetical protein PK133_11515 [Ferruginibacter sp.]|nr:hypothetical protein [Ferruginibacter sp.]